MIRQIYLNNGATSYPKPKAVALAVNNYIVNVGASINRSVYEQAQNAEMVTYTLRERLSRFFNHGQPRNVVLTPGNTWGLNMVIKGSLKPGDHVLVSSMEHNAVMRPLVQLLNSGIEFDRIPCDNGICKKKMDPLIAGGTGSASDSEELPQYMPDKFESGTMNLPGIYGFEAAMDFMENTGIDALMEHDRALSGLFIQKITELQAKYGKGVLRLVGSEDVTNRVGVISLDFIGQDNAEVSYRLDSEFGIMTRCGMHCAPSAHKTLNTFPQGVVRFSHGWFNTP